VPQDRLLEIPRAPIVQETAQRETLFDKPDAPERRRSPLATIRIVAGIGECLAHVVEHQVRIGPDQLAGQRTALARCRQLNRNVAVAAAGQSDPTESASRSLSRQFPVDVFTQYYYWIGECWNYLVYFESQRKIVCHPPYCLVGWVGASVTHRPDI